MAACHTSRSEYVPLINCSSEDHQVRSVRDGVNGIGTHSTSKVMTVTKELSCGGSKTVLEFQTTCSQTRDRTELPAPEAESQKPEAESRKPNLLAPHGPAIRSHVFVVFFHGAGKAVVALGIGY